MKTFRFLSCGLLFMAMLFAFVSCGNSKDKKDSEKDGEEIIVKGDNGKEYRSYQSACRDNEYNAAHEFLDLMKQKYQEDFGSGSTQQKKAYEDALIYVYTQEMMFLVANNDETSSNKIMYLLSEIDTEMPEHLASYSHEWKTYMQQQRDKVENMCNKIIKLAESQNNEDLAAKIKAYIDTQKEKPIGEE